MTIPHLIPRCDRCGGGCDVDQLSHDGLGMVCPSCADGMDRHTAYRRGLCVDCQQVKPAAGMPRCWPCHSEFAGVRLTPEQRRHALIRSMSGPRPHPAVYVLAAFTAHQLEQLAKC